MKTIEEASADYAVMFHLGSESGEKMAISAMKAFKAGVEFAQEWISIEEELPPTDKIILYKRKIRNGQHEKGDNWVISTCFVGIKDGVPYTINSHDKIDYWRPIELK